MDETTKIVAGVPAQNNALFYFSRFAVGDPAVYVESTVDGRTTRTLLVRDIEMARARQLAHIDAVGCPADFTPSGGLSGDRETATAQAAAELLVRRSVRTVTTDRTLPFIFAHFLQQAGIEVRYDDQLGVLERRVKTDEEIDRLAEVQRITEQAMEMACRAIGTSTAGADGSLRYDGEPLTSERLKRMIALFCLDRGCSTPYESIVAGPPQSADCHHAGEGPLVTEKPIIVDIFPRHDSSRYWGDCTRTAVHGAADPTVRKMHQAVIEAKRAAIAALRAGATGEQVHRAAVARLAADGYAYTSGAAEVPPETIGMPHGTGHGVGLDLHEPILLADGGESILEREVFTVEPGLYSAKFGSVRVEDMVVVAKDGVENLNTLQSGLEWR